MKIGYSTGPLAVIAVALLAVLPAAASACEFTQTPWGLRVSNCKLSELSGGRYDLSLDTSVDPPRLPLPNLRVNDVDAGVVGSNVSIAVEVQNNGQRNAGRFDVTAVVDVQDPLIANGNRSVGMTMLPPVSVPGLAIGTAVVYPGQVVVPNRTQDWDVCTVAVADAPPTGGGSLGRLLELNESDNQWQGCCRVYGLKPDTSVPPCL
jgi:hypothetical protein